MAHYKLKIFTVLIIVLFGGFFAQRYFYEQDEKKNVAQFLRQRYGQEFIVDDCDYSYKGSSRIKFIRTHVISKDSPPITFFVSRPVDSAREDFNNYYETVESVGEIIYEGYLNQRWEREVNARIKGVAEGLFHRPILISSDISIPSSFQSQLRGRIPLYFETRQTQPEIFADKYFSQSVWVISFSDLNESSKLQEAERIFRFIGELRNLGMLKYKLYIHYYLPTYLQEANRNIEKVGGIDTFVRAENGSVTLSGYLGSGDQWRYSMTLLWEDIEKIKNPSEIVNFFKMKIR